jgi:hypothetical protein
MEMDGLNSEVPRRGLLWFGAVAMTLFTAVMYFFLGQSGWTASSVAFDFVCGVISVALMLTLIDQRRYWWALRVVTGIVFILCIGYLIDEFFVKHQPITFGAPGAESPLNALRAFLIFGLPCLLYTLWGSTWGKVGQTNPGKLTRADIATFHVARLSRWLFLLLTVMVLLGAIAKLLVH